MSDTSLISSVTDAQATDTGTDDKTVNTDAPAGDGAADVKSVADTLYPDADEKPAEGDEKPAEGDKDDKDDKDKDDKDDGAKEPGEPLDLSEVEFDLPEGMELNAEALTDLGALAGELNLSVEEASKFTPIGVKLIEHAFTKQQEAYAVTRSEWRDTVLADKEIGGVDDKAQQAKLAIADKGLSAIGSPELRTLLNETGLGDNPEVIRAFYKAGLAASEDVVENGGSGDTAKGGLDAMYPTMTDKK